MTPLTHRFIEEAGATTQSLGLGRVVGQLYVYLYFSRVPRSLADMQDALGISKGSASTSVRQLEQWGAVRKVWVKGDRRDYYEAVTWFGRILKNALADLTSRRMRSYAGLLERVEGELAGLRNGDGEFLRGQLRKLRAFHARLENLWTNPLLQKLLK